MRVRLKSRQYRLVKFVLGKNAPTPQTMQNGCPYFWLLVLSLILAPFKLLGQFVLKVLSFPFELLEKFANQIVSDWLMNLDDNTAYDTYRNDRSKPLFAKIKYREDGNDGLLSDYIEKKYGIAKYSQEFYEKSDELYTEWKKWYEKREIELEKARQKYLKRNLEQQRREEELERKRALLKEKWDKRMKPIREGFAKLRKSLTIDWSNWNALIRATKRVVGGFITIILLGLTYFIINTLVLIFMVVIDFLIVNWMYVVAVIGILAFAGVMVFLVSLLINWCQIVINNYKNGKKLWYAQLVVYTFFYPAKYVGMGLLFIILKILWTPVNFLFYNIIWKGLCQYIIWGGIKRLGRGITSSLGIFGEYFSASYTDFCPGIEWVEEEE